ncbi:MAG TPA: peptidylprolyl isomerase, partial [Verrucomicrobiales bacterium]|nr:peptidylprolyl isomerase [Verrucomicrobiales bacterium]
MTISKRIVTGAALLTAAGTLIAAERPDGLYAEIETSKGTIVGRLEFEKAPLTVANFVGLAEGTKDSNKPKGTKFYDGIIFHRVIPGFMIQGGDPEGSGRGGPGYRFEDEFDPSLRHDGPGVFSMANAGPGSNGSQFFITVAPTPHLDDRHSVFGRVIEGQDVANAIANAPRNAQDRPNEEISIKTIKIVRVGEKAKAFKGDQAHFDELRANIGKRAEQKAAAALESVIKGIKEQHPGKELVKSPSGLQYLVITEGSGETPKAGTQIKAHYTGKFTSGKVFDSSVQRGEPISFAVGQKRVIPGWDEALLDMKKGEKRILVIPPDLAYGPQGHPGGIPPNSTLIF